MKKLNNPSYETLSVSDKGRVLDMVRRGCSRRDVMAWAVAGGASAAAAGALFTGAQSAWAQMPKRGGKLTFAGTNHSPADTLDPARGLIITDYFRARLFYNSLTRLTENLGWDYELAEDIIPNANATEFVFKIRKGITFTDGKTLNADDVVYSMNRHLGEDSVSEVKSLASVVKEWRKTGPYEVKAVLHSPNADLPAVLGTFHFKIIPNGFTDFSTAVGTGPYKLKEFTPGVRCIGVRNENSWEGGGHLDELEHFGIGDPAERLNAFLSGEVDVIEGVEPKSLSKVKAAAGRSIWNTKSSAFNNIGCRTDLRPFGDPDLILAMKHLMNRERLLKDVLKGNGALANDHPIGPNYFDHCAELPQREMDPDKAAFHFKKSGIGSTPVPVATAPTKPGAVEQCVFLREEAKKIGLNIDVKEHPTKGYWADVWMQEPISMASWNMRPTANMMMTLAFKSDAAWNDSFYQNPEFDRILIEVRGVLDLAKRKEMYCTLQEKIRNESGSIIAAHHDYVDAAANYVKGRTAHPTSAWGGAECPAFVWRDDV